MIENHLELTTKCSIEEIAAVGRCVIENRSEEECSADSEDVWKVIANSSHKCKKKEV